MARFWDSISSSFGRAVGFEVYGAENDYPPPTTSGKRKASEPRRSSRSHKARRYSASNSYRRAPGTYTTIAQEKKVGPRYLEKRQQRVSDIPGEEEAEEKPLVIGFVGHRDSLDRRPSNRTRRRPSTPSRRPSTKPVQEVDGDQLSGVAGALKNVFYKLTGTGRVESTMPATTEAGVQAQLLAEYPDEEIEARYLAEFQQDDYDDAKLSDGELGLRYFGPAPWAKNRDKWDDIMKDSPRIKSYPGKTVTKTHTTTILNPTAAKVTALKSHSYYPEPSIEVDSVARKKPEKSPVKPAVKPEVRRKIKLPVKAPVKPADRPVIPAVRPVVKPAVQSPVKIVDRPVNAPSVVGTSQVESDTLKKPTKKTVTQNAVKPIKKPVIETPEYIKEWTEAPYERLRTIYEDYPTSYLAQAQNELQEPMYAIRDVEVRDMMWQIQDGVEEVAALFQGTIPLLLNREKSKTLTRIYSDRTMSTSRVLKGVAGKGWTAEEDWHDVFASNGKRRALICGVIGNVLIEQVFKHPFFGGDNRNIDALFGLQRDLRAQDAFNRKHQSARLLSSLIVGRNLNNDPKEPKTILHPPENFTTHVDVVVTALDTHLRPLLLNLCKFRDLSKERTATIHWSFIEALTRLVGTAGLLSLQMAVDPLTVYYHVPVAKGECFSHTLHEAFNNDEMERTHPRSAEMVFQSDESRKRARNDEAVVSMVLMDGLTAYRAGGWEAPGSNPLWDGDEVVGRVYAKDEYVGKGYRGRLLTPGWVFCKWDRAKGFA
ncbi:uncharacterized protein CC84DRAFT_1262964 [Paraphaeosphaeria sporulosa]|uniref:Uncharacterized protein n=1 Tax=Paraphaeosphaeria sporulosa TaxID=1460663 RepID=A0A177C2C2_9PLEO|nr:uncharacterized protein CC84DRAFT_1262964 [Paraphaeosphaeria sporulosa]OAG00877.1 hypothetical protein CC84DRAFT_1262964 [Paraphaeosphaeria sporulosa]